MPADVPIRGATIRLGQLLKLAGLVSTGSEAKTLLATGAVSVNGERETRRGRQLAAGDNVRAGDVELVVVAGPDT
jgi:ribosome-associated protein